MEKDINGDLEIEAKERVKLKFFKRLVGDYKQKKYERLQP